jgi:hypothetical protein
MSGMKFRLKCADCGVTFFAPDHRALFCPKCARSHPARATSAKPSALCSAPPDKAHAGKAVAQKTQRTAPPPKLAELTPELAERIMQLCQERYAGQEFDRRAAVKQLSDELWVKRQLIAHQLHLLQRPNREVAPELQEQIITQYRGYIERLERPPGGRRRAISRATGVPYQAVRKTVYDWLMAESAKSPTPELSRLQLFQIEQCYFAELQQHRYRLSELPTQIAAQLSFATPWQVARWIDQLHDDEQRVAHRPAPTLEQEAPVIEAYRAYLKAPQPPERGLHFTLAQQLGDLSQGQVYRALLHFRHHQRAAYPLR